MTHWHGHWTLWIPEDKSTRLIREILKVIEDGEATNKDWKMITGKLNHYHPLLRSGFYNIIISHAVCQEKKKSALIKLKPET